ncbi:MAG: DUF1697 domain-containing protein [Bacteroidetes bacterium]|nr:MAG: DUF1697 domain-containing protein [Bacteroidota bacterium]
MPRYIAFLRGINVSGQKIIKMEELRKIFEGMKFPNVKTYIQSGNVIFDSSEKNAEKLTQKIEKGLVKALGYDVAVILRSKEEIAEIVTLDPFNISSGTLQYKKTKAGDAKPYVVFVSLAPGNIPKLPMVSPKGDVEIVGVHKNTFFCLSHPLPNGTRGFPNAFIEKEFKIPATTRNWNTVNKVLEY